MGKKEYNYEYEDGKVVRATECDIALNGDVVTNKVVVNTVKYYYDNEGKQIKKVITPASGTTQTIYYENTDDNTVVKFTAGGRTVTSHSKSNSFGRKTFDELQLGTDFVSRQFVYHAGKITAEHKSKSKVKSSATTQLVSQIILSNGTTFSYGYDAEERITSVVESYTVDDTPVTNTTTYTYDALGQLLTETVNGTVVNEMTYDNYGNILTKNGVAYTYDNTWKDLLTGYGEQTITYDAQGNPTSYLGHTLTWEKGRQLKSFDGNSYTYNANGIRTSKTVDGIKHTYTLDGTKILRETWGSNTLIPLYDNEDSVCGIIYNNNPYYFIKNLQGDVIAIVDKDATTVAKYSYDAWGVCSIIQDISGCNISNINPYRYRGYYYDAEIQMYYLQSRYYDPSVGRFVNADDLVMGCLSDGKVSHNVFSYCKNDPIMFVDSEGNIAANVIGAIVGGVIGAVGGYFLTNWLADKLDLRGWKRNLFVWGLTALIGAAAAAIGYFVGPYVAKAWNYLGAKLAGLMKGSFKKIGEITANKMSTKINTSKHLWKNVLGRNTSSTNIKSLIYKTIRKGTWKYQSDGILRIVLQQGKEYIIVTGNIINGVFHIGDAWVWNHIGNMWGF